MEKKLRQWLRLVHAPRMGPRTTQKLLDHFVTVEAVFCASTGQLQQAGLGQNQIAFLTSRRPHPPIERDLLWAQQPQSHLLLLDDPRYPKQLKEIADPPIILYILGDPEVLSTAQLAIVGSRNATPSALETSYDFAKALSSSGITITSGLALGIDAKAHKGALDAGGLTIAVAATGLDRVYPSEHVELANHIMADGAVISEFPIGTPISRGYFPRRNRIISGLSIGTLVTEAAIKSGSLITARLAMEQGREVLAMPSSIHNPLGRGCNQLIKQGAKLVETMDDVLEELAPSLRDYHQPITPPSPAQKSDSKDNLNQEDPSRLTSRLTSNHAAKNTNPLDTLDDSYRQLLGYIDFTPTPIDLIVERSQLDTSTVCSMLLMLEMHDILDNLGHSQYQRRY